MYFIYFRSRLKSLSSHHEVRHKTIRFFFYNNQSLFRLELCNYSGLKIYPGHGKRVVKVDGKVRLIDFLLEKIEEHLLL